MFDPASSAVVPGERHRARAHGGRPGGVYEVRNRDRPAIDHHRHERRETHASSAVRPVTGYLSITTNPADAAVYLDGQHVGMSPVQLLTVAAGEHRVRIVKTGYLENARVVTVGAGLAKNVDVRLTRTAAESAAAGQVVSRTGGGGGGS